MTPTTNDDTYEPYDPVETDPVTQPAANPYADGATEKPDEVAR